MAHCLALFTLLVHLFFSNIVLAKEPLRAVATIMPIHSLVSMVTEDLKTDPAKLLLPATADPHHFSLRPSQAKILEEADIVFFASDHIETFLKNHVKKAPTKYFPPIAFNEEDAKKYSHAWLDMKLAIKMLKAILFAYRSNNSDGSADYLKTVKSDEMLKVPQNIMDRFIERSNFYLKTLKPHKGRTVWFDSLAGIPFVEQFGIKGELFTNIPEGLKDKSCLVLTHGNNSKMQLIAKKHNHKLIYLDLLGTKHTEGSKQYFKLMDGLVQQLSDCLT